MGGGGVMRAAAKVAGITVANVGLRGVPAEHPVAVAARNVTRPVSAIVSASEEANKSVVIEAGLQRPCWELDDRELAGGEEEMIVQSGEPMPRLVFGPAPTIMEAKEATFDLKNALEKAYLSLPNSAGCGDSYIAGHESGLSLLSKPEYTETKACITSETTATAAPKDALKAFRLLKESPATQTVVASIASDPNVWHAVLQNQALVEFLESHKNTAPFSVMDPVVNESVSDTDFLYNQSPKSIDDSSNSDQSVDFEEGFMDYVHSLKTTVINMMSSLSDYFQNLFVAPSQTAKKPKDVNGSSITTFVDGAMLASFMGLAVMVIMVVVLKRG